MMKNDRGKNKVKLRNVCQLKHKTFALCNLNSNILKVLSDNQIHEEACSFLKTLLHADQAQL